jgi:PAS domain-containing protein
MTSVRQIEEQRLFDTIDREADGIILLDEDRRVVHPGGTLCKLRGMYPEEEKGKSASAFIRRHVAILSPDQEPLQGLAGVVPEDRELLDVGWMESRQIRDLLQRPRRCERRDHIDSTDNRPRHHAPGGDHVETDTDPGLALRPCTGSAPAGAETVTLCFL